MLFFGQDEEESPKYSKILEEMGTVGGTACGILIGPEGMPYECGGDESTNKHSSRKLWSNITGQCCTCNRHDGSVEHRRLFRARNTSISDFDSSGFRVKKSISTTEDKDPR